MSLKWETFSGSSSDRRFADAQTPLVDSALGGGINYGDSSNVRRRAQSESDVRGLWDSDMEPIVPPEDTAHEDGRDHTAAAGFGSKTIGLFGGFALLMNNMSGPGMMAIPSIFQEAGWLPCILCLIVVMVVATFSSTMLCEAMSAIPGNENFEDRVELTTLAKFFFGRTPFIITMVLFCLSLQAVNIASIVVSAQTMDLTIIRIFNRTYALEWAPDPGFIVQHGHGQGVSPFGDDAFVISLGFILVLLMAVPLGFVNLDDNIIVQKVAFILFVLIMIEWIVWFLYRGTLDFSNVPMIGNDMSQVLGTVIFNYAYVTTIPSWVNEKKPSVSVNKSMWSASLLSTVLFSAVGIVGAWAYKFGPSDDVLSKINDDDKLADNWLKITSQVTVYAFPLVALLTGIPIFSIIVRYNLVENQIMSKFWANMFAVLLPWVVAIPAYTGTGLINVINWTSLIINGLINFIIPVLLYIFSRRALYRKAKDHMVVRTFGEHHTQVLAAEVPEMISFRKPQQASTEQRFSAMPAFIGTKTADRFAWFVVVFFAIATIVAIVIAVIQSV